MTDENKQVQTEADKIWDEIKDKELSLFTLPGQKVMSICQPVPLDPSRCFLLFKASATLPALEDAFGKEYVFEAMDKYIVVSRKPKNVI